MLNLSENPIQKGYNSSKTYVLDGAVSAVILNSE